MDFLPVYIYFIALSFLVSIYKLKKISPFYLKIFSPFLFLTFCVETYANYLSSINKSNIAIYNFFSAFEFCFYLFLISCITRVRKIKNLARYAAGIYGLLAVLNILFIQGVNTFHTTTYAAGCLIIASFCVSYFYEIFRTPGAGKLENNPAFWICAGLLFFYCCGFPLWGLMNIWSKWIVIELETFSGINYLLNSFLYLLFTIAYLCSRTRNSTLSSS